MELLCYLADKRHTKFRHRQTVQAFTFARIISPMSEQATATKRPFPLESFVQIHIVFEYRIQRTPTRTNRAIQTRWQSFNVAIQLSQTYIDHRGYPDARALWIAERMFLKKYHSRHLPDVRLVQWRARLRGDAFILSEYQVFLPLSSD